VYSLFGWCILSHIECEFVHFQAVALLWSRLQFTNHIAHLLLVPLSLPPASSARTREALLALTPASLIASPSESKVSTAGDRIANFLLVIDAQILRVVRPVSPAVRAIVKRFVEQFVEDSFCVSHGSLLPADTVELLFILALSEFAPFRDELRRRLHTVSEDTIDLLTPRAALRNLLLQQLMSETRYLQHVQHMRALFAPDGSLESNEVNQLMVQCLEDINSASCEKLDAAEFLSRLSHWVTRDCLSLTMCISQASIAVTTIESGDAVERMQSLARTKIVIRSLADTIVKSFNPGVSESKFSDAELDLFSKATGMFKHRPFFIYLMRELTARVGSVNARELLKAVARERLPTLAQLDDFVSLTADGRVPDGCVFVDDADFERLREAVKAMLATGDNLRLRDCAKLRAATLMGAVYHELTIRYHLPGEVPPGLAALSQWIRSQLKLSGDDALLVDEILNNFSKTPADCPLRVGRNSTADQLCTVRLVLHSCERTGCSLLNCL
jgi:hypothetical protein